MLITLSGTFSEIPENHTLTACAEWIQGDSITEHVCPCGAQFKAGYGYSLPVEPGAPENHSLVECARWNVGEIETIVCPCRAMYDTGDICLDMDYRHVNRVNHENMLGTIESELPNGEWGEFMGCETYTTESGVTFVA